MQVTQVTRMMLTTKTGTLQELVAELKEELVFLAAHLFRARWQHRQYQLMLEQIPGDRSTVGMVLDFAENYTCSNQDEVQTARWYYEQVTVHPIVTYYSCGTCDEMVSESLVFISNDKNHDFNAVYTFTAQAVQHLRGTRKVNLRHVIQWTDGCAAQYKSKGPFADISFANEDFDCTWERNFFGSRHGKGASDGESAVVKHHASSAVKAGTAVIGSARELYEHCRASKLNKQPGEEKCVHFLRTFFFVGSEDIQRQRGREVKTVKGTRSLHSVRCVEANRILTRELSCLCASCFHHAGQCSTVDVSGKWQTQQLSAVVRPNPRPASPPPSPCSSSPADPPPSSGWSTHPSLPPSPCSSSPADPPPNCQLLTPFLSRIMCLVVSSRCL